MDKYLRITLSFLMLLIASYKDIKTRKIDDKLWIFFIPIGIIIIIEYFLKIIDFSILIHIFNF